MTNPMSYLQSAIKSLKAEGGKKSEDSYTHHPRMTLRLASRLRRERAFGFQPSSPRFWCGVLAMIGIVSGASPLRGAAPSFRAEEIDAKIQIGYGLAVADVNGDKKPDIVLADKMEIVWYENPGWRKHLMAEKLTTRDHVCVAAQDIDGDGRAEVAVGAEWNPGDTVNSGAVFFCHLLNNAVMFLLKAINSGCERMVPFTCAAATLIRR